MLTPFSGSKKATISSCNEIPPENTMSSKSGSMSEKSSRPTHGPPLTSTFVSKVWESGRSGPYDPLIGLIAVLRILVENSITVSVLKRRIVGNVVFDSAGRNGGVYHHDHVLASGSELIDKVLDFGKLESVRVQSHDPSTEPVEVGRSDVR
jgi:hypothetical protein